jgi:hypothetical protein
MDKAKKPISDRCRLRISAAAWAVVALLMLSSGGCIPKAASPAYKVANEARLAAVTPWLEQYAAEHPDKERRVKDVLQSWRIEVDAQLSAGQRH